MVEQSTNSITSTAHAKVNLVLAVGPADIENGMHPIRSWMHAIALGDEITVERSDRSSYRVCTPEGEPIGWAIEHDLAVRAHRAMESMLDRPLPVELTVIKHTPDGGGLGGGSSDAASVLMMVNELYALNLGEMELRGIAGTLGSDVHFFVDLVSYRDRRAPGAAVVSGFGEVVERVKRQSMPITLLAPPFGCVTGDVYRVFDRSEHGGIEEGAVEGLAHAGLDREPALFNDLAASAMMVQPELGLIHRALSDGLDRAVHVSGSGSTMFVLGRVDADKVHRLAPGVRVIETALV